MIVNSNGVAILEDSLTGQRFEILAEDLEWEVVGVDDRQMGVQTHYQATFEHEVLGQLSWNLWEYPVGLQNYQSTEVGQARIIQDIEYILEHEPEFEPDWDDMFDAPDIPTKTDFSELSPDDQVVRMVEWFNGMFEDPQNQTPYAIDKESPYNYEYIWGGPYDASEELQDKFAGIASQDSIEKAVSIVQDQDGIYEWAPSDNHPDMRQRHEDSIDDDDDDEFLQSRLSALRERISELKSPLFGSPEEQAARQNVLQLIQDFNPILAKVSPNPVYGGMGHNQPPSEFQLPQNIDISITNNINIIKAEATSDTPDAEQVIEATGALQSIKTEIADFIQMTKEQVKSIGSKTLAAAIVTGVTTLITLTVNWISSAVGFPIF